MRILHVIHSIDPRSGGPSNMIRNVVRTQTEAGQQVSLLATTAQSADPWQPRAEYVRAMLADVAFEGAEVFVGDAFGRHRPWSRYSYSPACTRWLRRRLSDQGSAPKVVHIHGVFSHVTRTAAALARRYEIPYIMRPAGSLDLECYRSGRSVLKRLFTGMWLRKDFLGAAFVQVTAPSEEEEMRRWLPASRIKMIPGGVAVPTLDSVAAKTGFLAVYPRLRGRRILLHVARIDKIKRLELLVEALGLVRAEHEDLVLFVAGQDDEHKQTVDRTIERLGVREHVVFAGFLSGQLKQWAFENASLFALPSRHENFGVAVVEAMAHGVPVLVTPGVASHVYVDASGCGLTVGESAEAIAEGIRRLLAADRDQVGRNGREYVAEHLSWERVVQQLTELYRLASDRPTFQEVQECPT